MIGRLQLNPLQKILEHKIIVSLTVLGGIIFTLWEPLTSIFYTGYFHTNIVLDLQTETASLDKERQLLTIHVIPSNKGNVPLIVKDKDKFFLEIKKIKNPITNQWVEPNSLEKVSKVSVLRNILKEHNDSYTLEPNGVYDEVESISLSNGIYWIEATLEYDGSYVNQSLVVKLPNKNN